MVSMVYINVSLYFLEKSAEQKRLEREATKKTLIRKVCCLSVFPDIPNYLSINCC